ncbi:MAG: hypothetical protein Q9198_000791 [Flavoplaca austrocitrina]
MDESIMAFVEACICIHVTKTSNNAWTICTLSLRWLAVKSFMNILSSRMTALQGFLTLAVGPGCGYYRWQSE